MSFMKILSVGPGFGSMRIDRRTDMTKLIVIFKKFVHVPYFVMNV
jgi:hypothetical protein